MMDILVTFPDGTTELRAANSPCVRDFESPPRAPHVAKHADIEGWCLDGRTVREIEDCRGSRFLWAWRLTGHTEEPYTLTGEWQSARVETVDERIARLTRERDILDFACDGYEQELTHLRRAARQAITTINGRDPGDVKASTLAAFLRDIAGRA